MLNETIWLQGPMTRSGRSPLKALPSPRRGGQSAAKAPARKPPQRLAPAAGVHFCAIVLPACGVYCWRRSDVSVMCLQGVEPKRHGVALALDTKTADR